MGKTITRHKGGAKGVRRQSSPPAPVQNISHAWGSKKSRSVTLRSEGALPNNNRSGASPGTSGGLMRRVSRGLAAAFLVAVLTASNIYAIPSKGGSQPSAGSRIVKIIRQIIGLDDWSWPKP
jgi:hypothetical protein